MARLPFADDLDLQSRRVTNLLDPENPQEAATMAYVDANGGGGVTRYADFASLPTPGTTISLAPNTPNTCLLYTSPSPRDS